MVILKLYGTSLTILSCVCNFLGINFGLPYSTDSYVLVIFGIFPFNNFQVVLIIFGLAGSTDSIL
jgi:hypothetical protein